MSCGGDNMHGVNILFIIFVLTQVARQYQIVPFQCLGQPMAMQLAIVMYWVEQAVSIMGQTSRCCMVYLMPQSQVSGSFEYPDFNMFTLSATG